MNTTNNNPLTYTIRDVAKMLDISEMAVHQAVKKGKLSAAKVAYGKVEKWIITDEAIREYEAGRGKRETKQYIVVLTEGQAEDLRAAGYTVTPRFNKTKEAEE